MGRPSEYSDAVVDEICRRLAKGESIIRMTEGADMPSETTVYRWLDEKPDFREKYARAREAQADHKFDQAWEIADAATAETVAVARLKVDTVKWQAGKLAPKKYGEKVSHEHGGEGGGAIKSEVAIRFV